MLLIFFASFPFYIFSLTFFFLLSYYMFVCILLYFICFQYFSFPSAYSPFFFILILSSFLFLLSHSHYTRQILNAIISAIFPRRPLCLFFYSYNFCSTSWHFHKSWLMVSFPPFIRVITKLQYFHLASKYLSHDFWKFWKILTWCFCTVKSYKFFFCFCIFNFQAVSHHLFLLNTYISPL